MAKSRKSNIELLRILAMVLIVISHYAMHSDAKLQATSLIQLAVLDCLGLGILGVDIFVLISAYFVSQSGFRARSFFRTAGKTICYGAIIAAISLLIFKIPLVACMKSLLPGSIGTQQWFVGPYLLMYLCSPVLNSIVCSVSKDSLKRLLLLYSICFCLLPGIFKVDFMMSRFVWFCFLYMIAAYYRKYGIEVIRHYPKGCFLSSMLFALGLTVATRFASASIPSLAGHTAYFISAYSPFLIIAAISLLELFLNFNISNALINKVASATFGVYLIHDSTLLRNYIWAPISLFPNLSIIGGLLYAIIVFTVCVVIDLFLSYIGHRLSETMTCFAPVRDRLYSSVDSYLSLE